MLKSSLRSLHSPVVLRVLPSELLLSDEYPTSSLSFLCSQTPLRQGCKGADLLWFSRTRRRQTDREKERERLWEQQPRSSHPAAGAHLFPSELLYSSQGQRDAVNERGGEAGREGERCKERREQALHTDKDLAEKEKGKRGEGERVEKSGIRHKKEIWESLSLPYCLSSSWICCF